MTRLYILPVLLLTLLLGTPASADDFQKGWDAYDNKDYATALRIWKPLAEQGNAEAQYYLGQIYYDGPQRTGPAQDYAKAMKWYRKAAKQGQPDAHWWIGAMYLSGEGVTENSTEALKWKVKSIELRVKLPGAKIPKDLDTYTAILGNYYRMGFFGSADKIKAYMWYELGENFTVKNTLAKGMTAAQIANAKQLSRECVKKKYKGC